MLARPGLPDFEYIKAETSQDAFDWMKEKGDDLKLFMGGTDLFVQMRDRGDGPGFLLDVKGLPGMQEISFDKKNGLMIGAAVTLNALSSHPNLLKYFSVLCQAADTVGNYQLRNLATLGGNICNASPSADMSPAALVYEGKVVVVSPRGERELSLDEFWVGPGKTALEKDEFLKRIHFPTPPEKAVGFYHKLGRSKMGLGSTPQRQQLIVFHLWKNPWLKTRLQMKAFMKPLKWRWTSLHPLKTREQQLSIRRKWFVTWFIRA